MTALKIGLGLFCLVLAAGYMFFPAAISRLNAVARDHFFNDRYVLTRRRQIGGLFLVLGIIALYMGLSPLLSR